MFIEGAASVDALRQEGHVNLRIRPSPLTWPSGPPDGGRRRFALPSINISLLTEENIKTQRPSYAVGIQPCVGLLLVLDQTD